MSYFRFLLIFLIPPLVLLGWLSWRDQRRGRTLAQSLSGRPAVATLLAHIIIAVLYTTPWDNYLVATRVWWYDPALVTGLTLGWVPIEEYAFFVLQTALTGLWLLFLARHLARSGASSRWRPSAALRNGAMLAVLPLWLVAAIILLDGWQPSTYLGLELVWALPPIMLQLLFGADILWHHRRLVALALAPVTLYLALADALAIGWGVWTINPEQSLNLLLGGALPIEELIFFLLTNTLVVFGITLMQASESQTRALAIVDFLRRRRLNGAQQRRQLSYEGQRWQNTVRPAHLDRSEITR